MECPRRWTIFFIVYLSLKGTVVNCQNVGPGCGCNNVFRDYSRSNPSSTELLNSVLLNAACNGALPDLLPMLQGQPFGENFPRLPPSQEYAVPLSVVPMPVSGCANPQEPIILSGQPIRPPVPNTNVIATTTFPSTVLPPNVVPALQQNLAVPAPPPSICTPQIPQTVSLENYPGVQNVGVVRPLQVFQPQNQFSELNPYNAYNQIFEPFGLPDINTQPINSPILPPPPVLPAINTCSGNFEIVPNFISPFLSQPTILTNDGQLPLNLQINVPTPNVQAPRITVVSATPPNPPAPPVPCNNDFGPGLPPAPYPYLPPIVVGKSKSTWRNLLPIILVALLNDRGCNNGGGCGCCSCSCNSGSSANNIPIPYPIPIPVNNPIINTCPYPYSRNREYRDDGDDDDDRKR